MHSSNFRPFKYLPLNTTNLLTYQTCGSKTSGSFVKLDVASNPWHCNGSMEWMKTSICHRRRSEGEIYYKPLMLAIALDHLFCYSPAELQGVAVVPVDDLDVNGIETCGDLHTNTMTMTHITQSLARDTISWQYFNKFRPWRDRHHFVDGIFKRIFSNDLDWNCIEVYSKMSN